MADSSTTQPKFFKRIRYRLEYFGLTLVAKLIPCFPYDTIEPIASALGSIAYHLDAHGRNTSLENLQAAFGTTYSPEERELIARQSYQSFARTMLCLFWSPAITRDTYTQYVRQEGLHTDTVHLDTTKNAVYFLAHFSNFEWLSLYSALAVTPGIVLTQNFKNSSLNPIFDNLRSTTGHILIPRKRALIRMLKLLRSGFKVGAAADLSVDPLLGAVPIRCFGMWTAGSPLSGLLATREKAPLFHLEIYPEEHGGFRMILHPRLVLPENATVSEIAQACWDAIEASIRKHPHLWLWTYKQWRFKPSTGDSSRYPSYAHTSGRFDQMLTDAGITNTDPT